MAVHKKDKDLEPYEVRGIDPNMKSLTMTQLVELMEKPHIRQAIEKINRIEGKPRMAEQILRKAVIESSPITKSVTEHEKYMIRAQKRKIDWLQQNGSKN